MEKQIESAFLPAQLSGGLLGPLPVVMNYLRAMQIKELVDIAVPPDPRHEVSHGECVEALLCSIFLKNHTLSHVAQTLSGYDLPFLFKNPKVRAEYFHDFRLGETLDALYGLTESLYAEVVFRGLKAFGIAIKRLHLDTTTISLYGDYEIEELITSLIKVPPRPDYGKSKDHRDDLKQLVVGLTVGDFGGPIFGRVTDGNTSDVVEFRHHLNSLAGMLGDLREALLVADCKLCTGPTIALALNLGFNLVTLVPDSWGMKKAAIERATKEPLAFLMKTPSGEIYHGKSFKVPYLLEVPGEGDRRVILRFLVVHSSHLQKQRRETADRAMKKEQARLEKEIVRGHRKTSYACIPDAEQAGREIMAEADAKHHHLSFRVESYLEVKKRRGRQPVGSKPEEITRFRLHWEIKEMTREESMFSQDGMYVLLTTLPDGRSLSDLEVLQAYKGQAVVERGFHWLKGPLRVAPVFLKHPSRIDVLGFIYLISMFLYALVQRDIRKRLEEADETLPTPSGPRTTRPTARSLFLLLDHLAIYRFQQGDHIQLLPKNFNKEQVEVLEKCGWTNLYFPSGKFT